MASTQIADGDFWTYLFLPVGIAFIAYALAGEHRWNQWIPALSEMAPEYRIALKIFVIVIQAITAYFGFACLALAMSHNVEMKGFLSLVISVGIILGLRQLFRAKGQD